ncbi:hypothetical protein J7J08_08050 [Stenotrophomonas sp. ISL-67]|uniref:hypothetical protein n=1 Tax=Stenotrophomonas sp. ISL-67 TaxID=2819171 RepID=UPI001BE59C8B|nr:hypothetical protein [Stenotrophomonas sp. ISL-67]MBT2767589.1 hypothetical protein [Stenotrophomonas sp. ISL-67]
MKIYRGMELAQWQSGDGLTRKGTETVEQLYAGDMHVGAGDPYIHVGGPCEGNALSMHTIHSDVYQLAFLSFSESFDVAAYYALQRRRELDHVGIVVETCTEHLARLGVRAVPNGDRVPWEQEVTVVMDSHDVLPSAAITRVHRIHLHQLRHSASALSTEWPSVTVPDFLRNVGY